MAFDTLQVKAVGGLLSFTITFQSSIVITYVYSVYSWKLCSFGHYALFQINAPINVKLLEGGGGGGRA